MTEVEVEWLDLDGDFAALEDEVTRVVQGLTVVAWNSILSKTPQFYGRAVASWNYSLNKPDFSDRSQEAWDANKVLLDQGPIKGLWRGHPVGIAIANQNNIGRDLQFALGDVVYFSNGVNHGEGEYAGTFEQADSRRRAVNRPGKPLARTFDWLSQKYQEMSANQARTLKTKVIGVNDATRDS